MGLGGKILSDPKLTIEIKNTRPVQLSDMTAAFTAYAEEYQRFAQRDGHDVSGENVQLYVHELRTGSIIADLVSLADQASIVLDHLYQRALIRTHVPIPAFRWTLFSKAD